MSHPYMCCDHVQVHPTSTLIAWPYKYSKHFALDIEKENSLLCHYRQKPGGVVMLVTSFVMENKRIFSCHTALSMACTQMFVCHFACTCMHTIHKVKMPVDNPSSHMHPHALLVHAWMLYIRDKEQQAQTLCAPVKSPHSKSWLSTWPPSQGTW